MKIPYLNGSIRSQARRAAEIIVVCVLAACGGGGGDSTPSTSGTGSGVIAVSFNVSSLTTNVRVSQSATIPVTATLSSLPSGNVFVFVVTDKPVLQTGATVITQNVDGSFTASLQTDPTLASGVYTGFVTLEICRDAQCASVVSLTGATVPYSITVVPAMTLTAQSGGVTLSPDSDGAYSVHSGDAVTITSNIPATWLQGSSSAGTTATATSTTTTTWNGIISGSAGGFVGVLGESVLLPQNDGGQVIFEIP